MEKATTVQVKQETTPNPKSNKMTEIFVDKVVLNICAGAEQEHVRRAVALISALSGMKSVETKAKKRIASWKIRPGLPIGSKATIRGKKGQELLTRLLIAVENTISKKAFSENGFSFGIKEYIDIPESKYDPKVGIIGLDVCVSLARPGYRVKVRKIKSRRLPKRHSISAEEAAEFARTKLGVTVE